MENDLLRHMRAGWGESMRVRVDLGLGVWYIVRKEGGWVRLGGERHSFVGMSDGVATIRLNGVEGGNCKLSGLDRFMCAGLTTRLMGGVCVCIGFGICCGDSCGSVYVHVCWGEGVGLVCVLLLEMCGMV